MRLLIAAMTLLCLCAGPVPATAGEVWTITSLDWPPHTGPDLPDQGTAIAALRRILAAKGIELRVVFLPWARAKQEAGSGDYAGYYPAWVEGVRAGFIASPPIAYQRLGVVAKQGAPPLATLDELFAHRTVGLVKTYAYPEAIARLAAEFPRHAVWVPDEQALARMLFHGRFETAITDPDGLAHTAREENLGGAVVLLEMERKALVLALRDDELGRARLKLLRRLPSGDVAPAPEP